MIIGGSPEDHEALAFNGDVVLDNWLSRLPPEVAKHRARLAGVARGQCRARETEAEHFTQQCLYFMLLLNGAQMDPESRDFLTRSRRAVAVFNNLAECDDPTGVPAFDELHQLQAELLASAADPHEELILLNSIQQAKAIGDEMHHSSSLPGPAA